MEPDSNHVVFIANKLEVDDLIAWIKGIPFSEWPQQHRIDHQLRPAMVKDLAWQEFGSRTEEFIRKLTEENFPRLVSFNRMLSVVMPDHSIHPHVDAQEDNWIGRIHVPLMTNPHTTMFFAGRPHRMQAGSAYMIDTTVEHAVFNNGVTPRIHLMWDVRWP